MPSTIEIFCCYAREDQELLQNLRSHLMPLQWQGLVTIWSDIDINAGTAWEEELHKHLEASQIILLLISPNFMASEYCYSKEMKRALERHNEEKARVIPILLRPILWKGSPFEHLQMLPKDAKPATRWSDIDEAFYNVAEQISLVVSEVRIQRMLAEAAQLLREQRYEGALVLYEQLLHVQSQTQQQLAQVYRGTALTLVALQRYEESIEVFEQAAKEDAAVVDAQFCQQKALALYELERYDDSLAAYERATQLDPTDARLFVEQAKLLVQLKRYDQAIQAYEQALRLQPTNEAYWIRLGDLHYRLRQYEQALAKYGQAITLQPQDDMLYERKGEILSELERWDEALAVYNQAIVIAPLPRYYEQKGRLLLQLKRYKEALATYEEVLQQKQTSSLWHGKGQALFQLEEYEEALLAYNEAIKLSCHPQYYHDKAVVYERLAQQAYEMEEQRYLEWYQPEEEPVTPDDFDIEEPVMQGNIDTVVVPAREDGFQNVFLKENRWYSIRIHSTMQSQIKYIAAYQTAPHSAITYVAKVSSIELWPDDPGKFVVNFAEPARKIGPIRLLKNGRVKAPQNLRYTSFERLVHARSLDDIWGQDGIGL